MRDALARRRAVRRVHRQRGDDRGAAGERPRCARRPARAIGRVPTAVAVPRRCAAAARSTSGEALKAALLAASGALLSRRDVVDRRRARRLACSSGSGIGARCRAAPAHVRERRRPRCARSPPHGDARAIGCTQATEIRYTPGLALVGAAAAAVRSRDRLQRRASPRRARQRRPRAASSRCSPAPSEPALRRAGGFDDSPRRRTSTVLAPRAS